LAFHGANDPQMIPMDRIPFQYSLSILQVILPLPFQQALAIFIGSAILHLSLIIVRGISMGTRQPSVLFPILTVDISLGSFRLLASLSVTSMFSS